MKLGIAVSVLGVLLSSAAPAREEVRLPQKLPDKWVVDDAHVLAVHEVMELEKRLDAIERELQARIVVVTLKTLDHEAPVMFATRATNMWSCPRRTVLLLVVGASEVHFQPNPALQEALRSGPLESIAIAKVVPRLRINDRAGGIQAGVDAVAELIRSRAPPKEERALRLDRSLPLEPLAPIATDAAAVSSGSGGGLFDERPALLVAALALPAILVVGFALAWWLLRSRSGNSPPAA